MIQIDNFKFLCNNSRMKTKKILFQNITNISNELIGNTMAKRSKLAQSAFLWVLVYDKKRLNS